MRHYTIVARQLTKITNIKQCYILSGTSTDDMLPKFSSFHSLWVGPSFLVAIFQRFKYFFFVFWKPFNPLHLMLELNYIFFGWRFEKSYYWLHYTKSVVTTSPPPPKRKFSFDYSTIFSLERLDQLSWNLSQRLMIQRYINKIQFFPDVIFKMAVIKPYFWSISFKFLK